MNKHSLKIYVDASISKQGIAGFGLYFLFNDKVCYEEGYKSNNKMKHIEKAELNALNKALNRVCLSVENTFHNSNIEVYIDNQTVLDCFVKDSIGKNLSKQVVSTTKGKIEQILLPKHNNTISFNKIESSNNLAHDLAYNSAVNNKTTKGDEKTLQEFRNASRTPPIANLEMSNHHNNNFIDNNAISNEVESNLVSGINKNYSVTQDNSIENSIKYLYNFIDHLTEALSEQKSMRTKLEERNNELKSLIAHKDFELSALRLEMKAIVEYKANMPSLMDSMIETEYKNTIEKLNNELNEVNKRLRLLENNQILQNKNRFDDEFLKEVALTKEDDLGINMVKSQKPLLELRDKLLKRVSSFL